MVVSSCKLALCLYTGVKVSHFKMPVTFVTSFYFYTVSSFSDFRQRNKCLKYLRFHIFNIAATLLTISDLYKAIYQIYDKFVEILTAKFPYFRIRKLHLFCQRNTLYTQNCSKFILLAVHSSYICLIFKSFCTPHAYILFALYFSFLSEMTFSMRK